MDMENKNMTSWMEKAKKISKILDKAEKIDKSACIKKEEFLERQKKVIEALEKEEIDAAFVYSDEHYCGDVPYLGDAQIFL